MINSGIEANNVIGPLPFVIVGATSNQYRNLLGNDY
jgi:hypothetical protein